MEHSIWYNNYAEPPLGKSSFSGPKLSGSSWPIVVSLTPPKPMVPTGHGSEGSGATLAFSRYVPDRSALQ